MLQFLDLCGIVEEDDTVSHKDTHQRDEAQDAGQRELDALDEQSHSHTEDAKYQTTHNEQSLADTLEVPQQYEEDNHNRHDESSGNLRTVLAVVSLLTTV